VDLLRGACTDVGRALRCPCDQLSTLCGSERITWATVQRSQAQPAGVRCDASIASRHPEFAGVRAGPVEATPAQRPAGVNQACDLNEILKERDACGVRVVSCPSATCIMHGRWPGTPYRSPESSAPQDARSKQASESVTRSMPGRWASSRTCEMSGTTQSSRRWDAGVPVHFLSHAAAVTACD